VIVVWSLEAKNLSEIYNYIFEDSPQNAEKVLNKIIDLAESLQDERYDYAIDPIINKEKFRHIFDLQNHI
jgi:plasmid stabilization system protein ParE